VNRVLGAVKGPMVGASSAVLAQLLLGPQGAAAAAKMEPTALVVGVAVMGWSMLLDLGSRVASLEQLVRFKRPDPEAPWEEEQDERPDESPGGPGRRAEASRLRQLRRVPRR